MQKKKTAYDIGTILNEMREEYWKGLSETEERQEETTEFLLFTLGEETFAFESARASEVLRIPRLVRVPGAQQVIAGIFNLRGEITAAMDIRQMLGLAAPPLGQKGRLVVVKAEAFSTGILVEEVIGVFSLPPRQLEPAVSSLSGLQREFILGQMHLEEKLVMFLDIGRLLASPAIVVDID